MIDQQKIKQAVTLLLEGIGEDVTREGLIDTPDRIARMYEEIYGGMEEDASTHLSKVFHIDSSEMVIEKDIPFYSTCEHHMLPFYGKVHIAYIPDGKVVGLSKLARTVEVFARRLQLQEQLTGQIVDAENFFGFNRMYQIREPPYQYAEWAAAGWTHTQHPIINIVEQYTTNFCIKKADTR